MHTFVRDYLEIFFPKSATGAKDIRNDPETLAWLKELNACVPNGVGVDPTKFTWEDLARMLAGQLYLVTVQHELLGSFMWNYQLWTHRQPAGYMRISGPSHWTSTSAWSTQTTS